MALAVIATAAAVIFAGQAVARTAGTQHAAARPSVPAKTIGYVTIFGDPVQLRFARVFQDAAKAVGWKVLFVDARGQPTQALRAMQNFINQKVDAIVASSVETPFVKPALIEARRKGIPTIAVAAIIGGDMKAWSAVYVESEAGLSNALAAYVKGQKPPAGKNHLGIIYNTEYLPGVLRYDVFKAALAKSNYNVTAQTAVSATDPTQGSQNAASSMLAADPKISAILAIFDWMAPPAVTAIQAAGRGDVSVYSYYADHTNLPVMLKPGSPLKAVVDGNVEQVSAVAVDQLLSHFVLKRPFDRNAVSKIKFKYTVYTKANAPKFGKGYLGPVSVQSVIKPWVAKWKAQYNIK